MSTTKRHLAILRTCAHCEWIFKMENNCPLCPKCGFSPYGARYAYGDKAYRYAKSQKPWKDRKMNDFEMKLDKEIEQNNQPPSRREIYERTKFASSGNELL